MPNLKLIFQILLFVGLLAVGNILWKYGLVRMDGFMTDEKSTVQSFKDLLFCPQIWAGAVFYVVATLYWFTILSRESLSYVYPMVSIGYVITALAGVLLFKETIAVTGWIGMSIILVGFVVLSIR